MGDRPLMKSSMKEIAKTAIKTGKRGKELKQSLKAHFQAKEPVRSIPKHMRKRYFQSLTPRQRLQLIRARAYYRRMTGKVERRRKQEGR